jgi:dCMP deaminase
MERLTREQALLMTAFLWGQRGTCERLKVGCVIAKDGRILVQGYNGAPPGLPHCPVGHGLPGPRDTDQHFPEQCQAVHAEANAISWAARNGVALEGSQLFQTHAPCLQCARMIITAGVTTVTYAIPYRLHDGVDLLLAAGVNIICQAIDTKYLNNLG